MLARVLQMKMRDTVRVPLTANRNLLRCIILLGSNHSTPEQLFLSKAFGESLQPSQVIPYYFRGEEQVDKEDITITTLITPNRFNVFDKLVTRYRGEFCAAIGRCP